MRFEVRKLTGQHTPGPWRVEHNEVVGPQGHRWVRRNVGHAEETAREFNAAWEQAGGPNLLVACSAALAWIEYDHALAKAWPRGLYKQMQAAIAKAEGGQS